MVRDDPFRGLKLSEQTNVGKIEQGLFTTPPTSAATPPASKPRVSPKSESPKPSPKPSPSFGNPNPSPSEKPKPSSTAVPPSRFDLKEVPLYKASFLFTQEELEALEDLKLELRREYDTKVTKNDLARSALHLLLEDHAAHGSQSYARRKMRKR